MQQRIESKAELRSNPVEWQARVDLAAAHRIAVMHGFHEGIFNHLTLSVPGKVDRYYQIPFGLHWSEVTASCFMEVGWDGQVLRGEGEVEASCYAIHAPIHRRLGARGAAVFHTHMPYASALTRLADPKLKMIGQTEVLVSTEVAYDMDYQGPACDPTEGERLVEIIGDKKVLFMGSHGIATVAPSVAQAYDLLYYVERAAQVQIYAMWTGQKLLEMPPAIVAQTKAEVGGQKFLHGKPYDYHFRALKRILDRREPDYAD
ncbi:MAG TPA: class II aldolase/adducin family protein [Hyphomicrobiaceae bacterium]|nr:class II aldolase/adducin family protein [Hyphomicrobiaceae bacterium]